VGTFGEEVVAAVTVAKVVVLPGLFAVGGCTGENAVAVDKDLDGADIAGEVVGLLVGGAQGSLEDLGVVTSAGRVLVAKPLLQIAEGQGGWVAMVLRARWLVRAPRESSAGIPAFSQRAGMMLSLR
jgi:hypothetical protein